MRWLNGITDAMDMNLGKLQVMVRTERPGILQFLGSQKVGQDWVTEQYNNENNEKGVKETFQNGIRIGFSRSWTGLGD